MEEVAPAMFVKVILSLDDCHWMEPVWEAKLRLVGEVPPQMVWLLLAVPPTDGFCMVTAALTLVVVDPWLLVHIT